jgi:hypothetical protein
MADIFVFNHKGGVQAFNNGAAEKKTKKASHCKW